LLAHRGIQHHALAETGALRPGMLVLGNDSHAPTLAAYGVLAFAGQPTTVAAALHTGTLALRVPPTLRVRVTGRLPADTTARDAALELLGRLRSGQAVGVALEYVGPGLAGWSTAQRAVLANATPEALAATALFPDLLGLPDDGEPDLELDLDRVRPNVARSGHAADVVPLRDLPRTRVDRVLVGTCAGGTFEEVAAFADALGDAPVAVPTLVVPASAEVAERLRTTGVAARLQAAGAVLEAPGCGFCFGFGAHRLGPGEVAVATGNRNGVGRLGDRTARVHLVSGRGAGRAARTGWLGSGLGDGPGPGVPGPPLVRWPRAGNAVRLVGPVTTDDLTPSSVPGVGTSSDTDPAVLRRLLLHHVDPSAAGRDLRGTVFVGDAGFGAGSNRASSVRALQAAGVLAVVARSVAPLYAQGARDEGFTVATLSDEAFYAALHEDARVEVDLEAGVVRLDDRTFAVPRATAYERALRPAGGVVGSLTGTSAPAEPSAGGPAGR
ncbi:MAG: aconitase family protein, partial [Trueperaceae bacterium]|nr:aconitase family protein [Trueperaceae bacterium]